MADPRVATNTREGTEPKRPLTFKADNVDIVYSATAENGSAVVGRAVMVSANETVRLTGAGSAVLGKLVLVEADGTCHVECGGVVDLPKGDGTIAVGTKIVGDAVAGARGYIRSVAAATLAEVAVASHHVLDVATATAIEVALGV